MHCLPETSLARRISRQPSFPASCDIRRANRASPKGGAFFRDGRPISPVFGRGGSVDKWIGYELTRLNAHVVTRKKSLATLLEEEKPHCVSRSGEAHHIDRSVLERLASFLTTEERSVLRLPISLVFTVDPGDECYIDDEVGARCIRLVEGFGTAYPLRDGRMWLPNSLAISLLSRYGGAIQALFL